MLIETVAVSPKTARDGKLEISPAAATQLALVAQEFDLAAPGGRGQVRLTSFECTCAKRAGEKHVHYFLESSLLAQLTAGMRVTINLDDERAALRVESA